MLLYLCIDAERQCFSPSPLINANYIEVFVKGFVIGLVFAFIFNVF